jgi:uncharacterized protein (TIGR02271 family)
VFDDRAEAEQVRNQLVNLGLTSADVSVRGGDSSATSTTSESTSGDTHHGGVMGFFRSMFGMDDESETHAHHYAEAVRRGSYVVCATAESDELADRATTVMQQAGAVNIEHRAARWREQGWSGYREDAAPLSSGEMAQERELNAAARTRIPVVQEEIQVGKRAVQRGGVRVYTRLVEQPIEEQVRLREEHARIERHPVDRAVTDADMAAMREGTIEVRETVEEPVVQKVARVTEEIEVGKDVEERTETVRDTVRHTEVQVDETPGAQPRVAREDRTRPSPR